MNNVGQSKQDAYELNRNKAFTYTFGSFNPQKKLIIHTLEHLFSAIIIEITWKTKIKKTFKTMTEFYRKFAKRFHMYSHTFVFFDVNLIFIERIQVYEEAGFLEWILFDAFVREKKNPSTNMQIKRNASSVFCLKSKLLP